MLILFARIRPSLREPDPFRLLRLEQGFGGLRGMGFMLREQH